VAEPDNGGNREKRRLSCGGHHQQMRRGARTAIGEQSASQRTRRECCQRDERALHRQFLRACERESDEHDVPGHVRREHVAQPDEAHSVNHACCDGQHHERCEQIGSGSDVRGFRDWPALLT
jgi:hypothetical protein